MYISSPLNITALWLALCSVAFAQSPASMPPTPPAAPPKAVAGSAPQQFSLVTQSSRVRAFNSGPGGELRSLYLQSGSVVDLAPGLGTQIGPAVRKGEKITVTGMKSEINGQFLVRASRVRLNDQTFSANVAPGPAALAEGAAPLPPAPRRGNKPATPAPGDGTPDSPPPPTGTDGPPLPPHGFAAAPPSAAGWNGSSTASKLRLPLIESPTLP